MILDALTIFSGSFNQLTGQVGQAVNGAGSFLSTNTLDSSGSGGINGGVSPADMGIGEGLDISISVLTAPTVGTSVQFQLVQADDAALSVNLQVINQTDAYPIASLPAGAVVYLHMDRAAPYPPKRFLGLRYVNVGAIATASYIAAMVKNPHDFTKSVSLVKSGYAIS